MIRIVSMGRPYNEKFADVKWEKNDDHLQAWKEGRTGVPIIDAVRSCPYRFLLSNSIAISYS